VLNKVGKNSLIVEDTIDTMVIQQVNMKKCRYIGSLVIVGLFLFPLSSLAQVSSSQTAGGILQQEKMQEKEKKLKERIQKKKEKAEKAKVEEISPKEVGPKVLIKTIKVEGATLIKEKDIQNITSQYEGKELSLFDMQKIADLITDEYRKKGYLTSWAYIPPQTIKKGVLIIRVIEGKAGSLKIEGNRYFRTSLLKKKLNVQPGKPLDYSNLQRSLTYINEHPDRFARAVLRPGKEPGTTDIIIKVKDRLPIHVGFEYDNFGSRYIAGSLKIEGNYLLGVESSRDEVRVLKTGLDVDFTDAWGRNIFTLELDAGVPRMWGALSAKDPASSRVGAGGEFLKWTGNYFRLQPGPFSSSILWKNSFQLSGYSLVASEQFQIGGPATVRGYPPAEYSGDKGYCTSLEWSFPPYFLPKTAKLPLSKNINLYDALRIVVFYDWATVRLNRILAGEKNRTLKGYGFGLRFNPTDRFSFRAEIGYPWGGPESSDNDSYQVWVELKWKY